MTDGDRTSTQAQSEGSRAASSQTPASMAANKVQEAAANIHRSAANKRGVAGADVETVARRYFAAIDSHDVERAVAMWAPGGRENVRGQVDVNAPEGVREFIGSMVAAMPDVKMDVIETTTEGERCAVQWRMSGTFAGSAPFNGVAPTGSPVSLEGVDVLTVRDGLVQGNEAFPDGLSFAREIGMMPPQGSGAEQRLMGAFNFKTKVASLPDQDAKLVAEGVWVVQGHPGRCNVYLIEDAETGGVTVYDAGARTMVKAVASAAAKLGGAKRIVLGHGHTDHRGVAPALGVPVLCHPDEREDAEGSGGFRYWPTNLAGLPTPQRQIHRMLHRYAWDAGPVKIAGTLSEGDQVAGFTVVHLPGHAPGLIGLWRESDRLALVSDCFYTLEMWGRSCPPHVPVRTYNYDTAQAQASIRKLAEMEPAAAWPGHANPITGDVRSQLLVAADTF
ncbi:MAG TPA: nuclear transport factor 2 family protein [Solirubrobacteraceae bacterium]|jgi:glyoxylase-like metal-dependent hydrolase (beta-lactamase superfamily II)/predicted ester cyclase|nr:nuclear transport factor 2 family protein [Solirubrobacteraceae bacterium]